MCKLLATRTIVCAYLLVMLTDVSLTSAQQPTKQCRFLLTSERIHGLTQSTTAKRVLTFYNNGTFEWGNEGDEDWVVGKYHRTRNDQGLYITLSRRNNGVWVNWMAGTIGGATDIWKGTNQLILQYKDDTRGEHALQLCSVPPSWPNLIKFGDPCGPCGK
jgi:hypothetical protein